MTIKHKLFLFTLTVAYVYFPLYGWLYNRPTVVTLDNLNPVSNESIVIHAKEPLDATTEPKIAPRTVSEKDEVKEYIKLKFGKYADKALKIAECESNFRKNAYNKNKNGSEDYGPMQINTVHIKRHGTKFMTDWKENINVAYDLWMYQGFAPWVCANKLGLK